MRHFIVSLFLAAASAEHKTMAETFLRNADVPVPTDSLVNIPVTKLVPCHYITKTSFFDLSGIVNQ
jgi:hypothetical protein